MIKWTKGALGYPSSDEPILWHYWTPTMPNGKFRAWYQPTFLVKDEILLGRRAGNS